MKLSWKTFKYGWPAIWRKVWRIVTRQPLFMPDAVAFARRDICYKCPLRVEMQCSECTCSIILKTQFTDEACPLGKW